MKIKDSDDSNDNMAFLLYQYLGPFSLHRNLGVDCQQGRPTDPHTKVKRKRKQKEREKGKRRKKRG